MKQKYLFTVSVIALFALLIAACVPVGSVILAPAQTSPDQEDDVNLFWPDHKGRMEIPNIGHNNYCSSSTECVFFGVYAFENIAIGDAHMSLETIDGLNVLKVDGIDSTLENGVRQLMPGTTVMETFLLSPNFSLSSEGATLKTTQIGVVDGEPNQEFSSLIITNVGDQLKVEGDWSYINPESYEIRIYQGKKLVTVEKGLETGEMFLPIVDFAGEDCEIQPPHRTTGELNTTAIFTIPGRGEFEGDNFAVIPEGNTRTPELQDEIVMLAKDTGPLYIVQQYAGVDNLGLLEEELGMPAVQ